MKCNKGDGKLYGLYPCHQKKTSTLFSYYYITYVVLALTEYCSSITCATKWTPFCIKF